jgi:RimJ/RimL family protein N-acetyltransferase
MRQTLAELLLELEDYMAIRNPYECCPVYRSNRFSFRLVRLEDAEDLLVCYSDPLAQERFNSDNCTSDFKYQTLDEMKQCLEFWLEAYRGQGFIRFSIVDKTTQKVIGTIEMFGREATPDASEREGILRIDLASQYEREEVLAEILETACAHFPDDFGVTRVLTKAVPRASDRRIVLLKHHYTELNCPDQFPFPDYFTVDLRKEEFHG